MIRFLERNRLWSRVRELVSLKELAQVAVAFCGEDAPDLVPLPRGSILVVDASVGTIKAGGTSPSALARYMKSGVQVFSSDHLHAKVFVFGRTLVLGSNNLSRNSTDLLTEAGVETNERSAVQSAIRFIDTLEKRRLGPEEVAALARLYRKPRHPFTGARPKRKSEGVWIVPLEDLDWDAEDDRQAEIERPKARSRLRSNAFKLDEFQWPGGRFAEMVARHQRVLQLFKLSRTRTVVIRDSVVVGVRAYRKGARATRQVVVFLEVPRRGSSITLKDVSRRNTGFARFLRTVKGPRFDRSTGTRRAIQALWKS